MSSQNRYDLIGAGWRIKGDVLRASANSIQTETQELDRAQRAGVREGYRERLGDWGVAPSHAPPLHSSASPPALPHEATPHSAVETPFARNLSNRSGSSALASPVTHTSSLRSAPQQNVVLNTAPLQGGFHLDRVSRALQEMRPVEYRVPSFGVHSPTETYTSASPVVPQSPPSERFVARTEDGGGGVPLRETSASPSPPSPTVGSAVQLVSECLGGDSEVDELLLHSALFDRGERKGKKERRRRKSAHHHDDDSYDASLVIKAAIRMGLRTNPTSLGGVLDSVAFLQGSGGSGSGSGSRAPHRSVSPSRKHRGDRRERGGGGSQRRKSSRHERSRHKRRHSRQRSSS